MANKTVTLTLTDNKHGEMEIILTDAGDTSGGWTSEDKVRLGVAAGRWTMGYAVYPLPNIQLRAADGILGVAVLLNFSIASVNPDPKVGVGDGTKLWGKGTFFSGEADLHWVVTEVS